MRDAKPQCFDVSGKKFMGNEKFQGNIYLKPEESPEDMWFLFVNGVMSPYELYEILSGFSFLVSRFSNLSIILTCILESNPTMLANFLHDMQCKWDTTVKTKQVIHIINCIIIALVIWSCLALIDI